ncbi:MAG: hypothetical protein ACI9NT_001388 [Bacteroidia bacterium]|jgi:hypothetical protein
MGTVVEFPAQGARGIAYLETQLRQLLSAKGADEKLLEFAVEQLLTSYNHLRESERYSFSVRFPDTLTESQQQNLQDEINSGLEGIRAKNHTLLLELTAQLLLTRIQLFQQQRPD